MSRVKNKDVEVVSYILMFLVFLVSLATLFFIYRFINELVALVAGIGLLLFGIHLVERNSLFKVMRSTLIIQNEGNKAQAEVEKFRQQTQVQQLKAFQEIVRSESRQLSKKPETFKVLDKVDKEPGTLGFERRLLTVHEDLFIDIEDGDFRIVEE